MQMPIPVSRTEPKNTEHLFRSIASICGRVNITRVGDVTGLDRIGLPVVQAVRPDAMSEVTSLGRGKSLAEAAVGALMEALERFFSETIPQERLCLATADELIAPDYFENLVVPQRRSDWRGATIPWILGLDVVTGKVQPVPLELVHTCYTEPPPIYDGIFVRTTTGLACHRTAYEAFFHGLFECIERDAIARAFETHGFFDRMRIEPFGLGVEVEQLMGRASKQNVSVALWHASSPAKVPVVWCQTIETGAGEPILAVPTEGYAAGPTIEVAAYTAIFEALAARAGAISGTRDDQTSDHYRKSSDRLVARARDLILKTPFSISAAEIERPEIPDLASLVERIENAGLGPVLAIQVGSDFETGIECVRTILPRASVLSVVR
jgi:ribosomal protein S12 methylthiotransferase accessory factor